MTSEPNPPTHDDDAASVDDREALVRGDVASGNVMGAEIENENEAKPEVDGSGDPAEPTGEESSEPIDNRAAAFRLGAVLVVGAAAAVATHTLGAVLVVLAVVLMVAVHELGHFATAKWSGMKVTEYFLGFGPKLWSVKRGETEYGIKAIPAGAYVRIIGMTNLEEVEEVDEPRTYRRQPYWQRLMVAGAGSFMHFVMAFFLLVAINGVVGLPEASTKIGSISELRLSDGSRIASPAQRAGLQLGDRIVAVDGRPITEWKQIPDMVRGNVDRVVTFSVVRDGRTFDVPVTPIDLRTVAPTPGLPPVDPATAVGFVGVGTQEISVREAPLAAIGRSTKQMGSAGVEVMKSLGRVFSPSGVKEYTSQLQHSLSKSEGTTTVTQPPSDARFVSPVGLVSYANDAADAGLRQVLLLLFSINIFVGIFNLVPLLPFDGGHIAVATYERLRSWGGRRHMVDFAKLLPVSYAVVLLLVFIGLSSIWLDVFDPLPNAFE